jgi:diaminobutyrate-2-oxoglutarate transaminase
MAFKQKGVASRISEAAFERGLIIETAGGRDSVLKLLPSLVIEDEVLVQGLDIIEAGIAEVAEKFRREEMKTAA